MRSAISFVDGKLCYVTGKAGKNGVQLVSYGSATLPQNTLKNGEIMDEKPLQEILRGLYKKKQIVKNVYVSVGGSNILHKEIEVPFIGRSAILKTVRLEFGNLDSGNYRERVFDYTVLESRHGEEMHGRVLGCAFPKAMLDSYVSLLKSAGLKMKCCDIELNCDIKALSLIPELTDRKFTLSTIHGEAVHCALFDEDGYVFSNRSQLGSSPGTDEYAAEVVGKLSAINQFYKSERGNVSVEYSYFYNVEKPLLEKLHTMGSFLGIAVGSLPEANGIQLKKSLNEEQFHFDEYLTAIGCLMRK